MATSNRLSISNFALSYNTVINDANFRTQNNITVTNGVALVVPYVADFTTAQPNSPRPYYCTMMWDGTGDPQGRGDGSYFTRHDWYFFHIPSNITVSMQPQSPPGQIFPQLYVDPDWQC